MSYEILVGLDILDEVKYEAYRAAMKPILTSYLGHFGYDFKVSEVLIAKDDKSINRVFTLNFKNKNRMDDFFTDAQYLEVKHKYFEHSVGDVTIISSYEQLDAQG
ncbi:DUF1330 domain-containing protein [Shewanella glacialimarina]|uniref:DUF1330 domain-containing protein n=1 Tax=Shewanella glacialimarina TaxID=2590884 RepID=UPI001CF901D6|nr:DUF1330 domain-containing protein [Shewanella glacialimarina]UCX05748.1 DUF1330 domain-containing protein [Shewanella glacialimarina]